jgi:hypothetical protein
MPFETINLTHVVLAALAAWALGYVYYTLAYKFCPEEKPPCDGKPNIAALATALLGAGLSAYVLDALLHYIAPGNITSHSGAVSAFFVWLGFTLPPIAINNAFMGGKVKTTVIDGFYWLLTLTLQGALLGGLIAGTIKLPV